MDHWVQGGFTTKLSKDINSTLKTVEEKMKSNRGHSKGRNTSYDNTNTIQ